MSRGRNHRTEVIVADVPANAFTVLAGNTATLKFYDSGEAGWYSGEAAPSFWYHLTGVSLDAAATLKIFVYARPTRMDVYHLIHTEDLSTGSGQVDGRFTPTGDWGNDLYVAVVLDNTGGAVGSSVDKMQITMFILI